MISSPISFLIPLREPDIWNIKGGHIAWNPDRVFIDCRVPHYYKTIGTHWKYSELHFYGNCAEHIFQCFAAENLVVFSQPLDGAFIPMLEKLIELHDGIAPFRELQISTQLQSLLVMLLCNTPNYERAVRKIPEHLNYLLRYMENNYTKNLSLDYKFD